MIGRIKEVDGEKKIEWIAGRAEGQGVPIGCIMAIYGNTAPNSSWLICDGSTFDAETYPALALYLGGNRLPDLRECVLVGAGQSDNEYDASTNPNGIHAHDVYDVGEFKDDQIQNITGKFDSSGGGTDTSRAQDDRTSVTGAFGKTDARYDHSYSSTGWYGPTVAIDFNASRVARTGSTTHGKQVGVNYIIKATSVSAETDHAAILAQIQRWNSYSTEETLTGKTWIDGKPIYRKCFTMNSWVDGTTYDVGTLIDEVVSLKAIFTYQNTWIEIPYMNGTYFATVYYNTTNNKITFAASGTHAGEKNRTIIEYTKTTD